MNKSDLIRATAEKQGMGLAEVEKVLDCLLDLIAVSLACGEPVLITKFGKFEPRVKNETVRINPATGDEIYVPAKRAILFRAAPALKVRVNK